MADGDIAASLGWHVPADTDDKRLGAQEIRKALDLLASHVINFKQPIALGGTGATTAAAARAALGITAANVPSLVGNVQVNLDDVSTRADAARSVADAAIVGATTPDVYNRNITETRRAVWAGASGPIGFASSSATMKQDFALPEITVEQLRLVKWTLYRYRREVAREKREPGYKAATEIGYTAQALDKAGLWPFVIYEAGKPVGIHYELLGVAALELAQRAWDELDTINARLDKAGI